MDDQEKRHLLMDIQTLRERVEELEYQVAAEQSRSALFQQRNDLVNQTNQQLRAEKKERDPYYQFYKAFQESMLNSPALAEDWQRFCLILRLTDPDQEKYDKLLGKI
ncbi:MAG: hypothetical protein EOP83_01190 [Verrucomicrobiaceae bacterium]|nr:MAG: hypothetical protein EOP83_01190 [Verrucomicrobiaceae bacterium]